MTALLTGLVLLASLGSLICAIIVLIQLFKAKGAGHGILGIFCGLYPFIWGWINATALNLKKVMIAWTILLIGMIILQFVMIAVAAKTTYDAQPPMGSEMAAPTGN